MDSIFGIGSAELLVILLLAGILMGPQRIRQIAYWLGKVTAQMQIVARGFARQLNAELDAADGQGDLRQTLTEMQDLRRELESLKREVSAGVSQPIRDGRLALEESRHLLENSIKPPDLDKKASVSPASLPPTAVNGAPPPLPKPLDIVDDPD
jgi:sec-independent protein translocase protein TatB